MAYMECLGLYAFVCISFEFRTQKPSQVWAVLWLPLCLALSQSSEESCPLADGSCQPAKSSPLLRRRRRERFHSLVAGGRGSGTARGGRTPVLADRIRDLLGWCMMVQRGNH